MWQKDERVNKIYKRKYFLTLNPRGEITATVNTDLPFELEVKIEKSPHTRGKHVTATAGLARRDNFSPWGYSGIVWLNFSPVGYY